MWYLELRVTLWHCGNMWLHCGTLWHCGTHVVTHDYFAMWYLELRVTLWHCSLFLTIRCDYVVRVYKSPPPHVLEHALYPINAQLWTIFTTGAFGHGPWLQYSESSGFGPVVENTR